MNLWHFYGKYIMIDYDIKNIIIYIIFIIDKNNIFMAYLWQNNQKND
jgi:hypothetical protein